MAEHPLVNIERVIFRHIVPTTVSRSISGARQGQDFGGGYWRLSVDLRPLNYREAKRVAAFYNSLNGRVDTFTYYLPDNIETSTPYRGDIFVNGASQTGTEINVNGMIPARTVLHQGDFIKFENARKVYQVQEDLISDALGEGVLKLHMPIVGTLPINGESVVYRSIPWTVALAEDTLPWDIDAFSRSRFSVELEEVWD